MEHINATGALISFNVSSVQLVNFVSVPILTTQYNYITLLN